MAQPGYVTSYEEAKVLAKKLVLEGKQIEHVEGLGWRPISDDQPSARHRYVHGSWRLTQVYLQGKRD